MRSVLWAPSWPRLSRSLASRSNPSARRLAMAHPIAKPWAGHPRHHRSAESAIRLVAGSKQVRITHPSVATVRRIVHDIGCASEEEAAVANVPDSLRGTPAAESGGKYEKRTQIGRA